jgi:phage baseplate assembly protein W
MSIQDRQQQLMATPEFKNAMREWEPRLNRLGSTSKERLERILDLSITEMTAYSDPWVQERCSNPGYLSDQSREMDRILSSIDLLPIVAEGGQTLNAATLARYAWLHEYSADQLLKQKAKLTINHLIQLSRKYLYSHPVLLAQLPRPSTDVSLETTQSVTRKDDITYDEQKSSPSGGIRLDLDQLRQSVYDLIDKSRGKVLFLEYLTRYHKVDDMSASEYKNQYHFYKSEYNDPQIYTKVIEHNNCQYNFKIETFRGEKDEFPGPEILACVFGYAISGLTLVTIWRKK